MRLLLDTHIYLWCITDDKKLSSTTKSLIMNASDVYISSVSIWELSIKQTLGKLDADLDAIVEMITRSGFTQLPLTAEHAAAVAQLPLHHRDPFDRILVAQAIYEPLRFLTADHQIKQYSQLVELV